MYGNEWIQTVLKTIPSLEIAQRRDDVGVYDANRFEQHIIKCIQHGRLCDIWIHEDVRLYMISRRLRLISSYNRCGLDHHRTGPSHRLSMMNWDLFRTRMGNLMISRKRYDIVLNGDLPRKLKSSVDVYVEGIGYPCSMECPICLRKIKFRGEYLCNKLVYHVLYFSLSFIQCC